MMSRCTDRFLIVLALLCAVVDLSHAIYDPREVTTKPPKRRDPELPWFLRYNGSDDLSRSPKWWLTSEPSVPRKPFLIESETRTWSPWNRNRGSDIEQRTEISAEQQSTTNNDKDGGYSLEYSQFEQQENKKFLSNPPDSSDLEQKQQTKGKKQNVLKENDVQTQMKENQDFYEGIPADTTKPHEETIFISTNLRSTVARYDSKMGVQCPEFDSTGQFIYPPDCKFFVNCWKGRAFVQPCAPGTLFNPNTLECDFPHKVKCYGGEIADFPANEQLDSSGRREPLLSGNHHGYPENEKIQEPRCPPHVTGLIAHPSDCTKFLQCANGGTFIMDCAPGTVFNPAVSVCDWPNKVRGCEDALKPKEEITTPLVPFYHEDLEHDRLKNKENQATKITCPSDYTGLLPHPETCKKFLQCVHGGTFIMDCGPGTAFNPSISVCDWPYNVPGCSEEKLTRTQQSTGPAPKTKPSLPHSSTDSHIWHHTPQQNHRGYPNRPVTTTTRPGTDWESFRPTWKPSWKPSTWTTAIPPYAHGHHASHNNTNTNMYYGSANEQHRQNEHGQWDQSTGSGHPQTQWSHNQGSNNQNPDNRYHHHYHHHYYPHVVEHPPIYDSNTNIETQQPVPPYGQQPPQRPGQKVPEPGNWNQGYHHQHHHYYHGSHDKPHPGHDYQWKPEESDQQTQQPIFDQTDDDKGKVDYSSNGNIGGNVPANRRNGQDLTPNRQEYGRTVPEFTHSRSDQPPTADENVYVDNKDQMPMQPDTQAVKNKTTWTQFVSRGSRYTPDSWSQLGPEQQATLNRRWDQGSVNQEDKFRESRTNIYQSTVDKDADSKVDQWTLNTNIFESGKKQHRPGIKDASSNSSKPPYPSSVYVNVNGTRGHFITKEIEVNQGHSKTKTYSSNDLRIPKNKNNQNIYVDSQTTNFDYIPSMVLQPPLLAPNYSPSGSNNNQSYGKNISSNGTNRRTSKNYWINNSTSMGSEDLAESGTNYNRPILLPYPPPDRSLASPTAMNFSGRINYHPPVPSTNLQPPPRVNRTFPFGWQYPSVELQPPPYHEPPNRISNATQRPRSTTNFQSPDQLTPPYFISNVTREYPHVPSSNLEPPYEDSSTRYDYLSTSSTTRKNVEEHVTSPPKNKFLEHSEKPENIITTTDSSVPPVSIEDDNSPTLEYPDILEPDLDHEVDVLDDRKMWKPVLIFDNKTETTTKSSVIMKINKKRVDVDLFNIEADPLEKVEPPFPSYYVPPVEPISLSKKASLRTPTSGQVIRLRGGTGPHDGYVEVQGVSPGWGVVCDSRNNWTLKEAHVVCKQLGYMRGAEMAWQGRNTRNGVPTWIAANSVLCQGNEAKFQSCKFKHEQECRVERDAIGVRCVQNRVAHCRKDEIPYDGQCYHLADPESGLNHAEALNYCSRRQARLIDITSQVENDFVSEWLVQKHPEVVSIMTSGVGFTTMNRTLWLWEDSSRAKFRFTKWWPGWMEDKKHPPFVGSRPLCLVMKRKFPCHERPDSICVADYFFWDTEDCASSMKGHSYICKRPYDDIGCIYGKGGQYAGTANVTASGKDCLSWGDEKVAHSLTVNVVNRDVREKLKIHNYCRNPNPNRESRPWCYTGPGSEREYCDIPSCGHTGSPKSLLTGKCKPKHFECSPGECIPSPWVCDGEEDCTNAADERNCGSHMDLYQKHSKHRLEGHDVQKWLNTPLKTCAFRCKEADFTCRSFAHKAAGNVCFLSDSNVGMTGSLKPNKEFDYYEMKSRSVNCEGMFVCGNRKCINQTQVCNGKNDCNDRSDENICTVENLDYDIRLAGSDDKHEGRIEVKILGVWGQVCDDGFGMIDADVICKELGFTLGALEVRTGGFYGNMDPPTRFMVDQLRCRGNETSLRECDFEGWGVHNCQPEEAVGVVCKTAVESCQDGHWKCDGSPMCIPTAFICDEVVDCPDGSDESSAHCDAPFEVRLVNGSSRLEGRVEVRHHGIWGTVCDDDFSTAAATVICRSLGYGGRAIAKKDGFFGPGEGPIWLDEVFCYGNETQLNRCEHNHWGQHNCNHDEDAGVICTPGDVNDSKLYWKTTTSLPERDINDILPANCGRQFKGSNTDVDLILEKVVRGSIAPKGAYPWQASIRVRGHSRSNHWCGAVILSSLHVLTAAHCLEGYNKGTYFVRAGDYNTEINEGTEVDANIEDYYIHESFRKGHRMNNDIALVLLKGQGIPLGKDIMPICLPPENADYPAGLNCTISGFGSIETGKSTHSKDLRYGWIPLLDQSECRAGHVYGEGAISDGMVCAGYLDEGIDTCDGDSGGPLACLHNEAFTLYGITSWGQHCGKANKPGVYVRVSHYRRWIDQKIKDSLGER
ncbi:Prss12 [Anthophora plagiata]